MIVTATRLSPTAVGRDVLEVVHKDLDDRAALQERLSTHDNELSAEHMALASYLDELGERDPLPIDLHVDNTGARDLAYNPEHHAKSKHIERRHLKIRELVLDAVIRIQYIASKSNLADIFTKVLTGPAHARLRAMLMGHESVVDDAPPLVRGGVERPVSPLPKEMTNSRMSTSAGGMVPQSQECDQTMAEQTVGDESGSVAQNAHA